MLEFSEMHPATIKNAAEDISLGTSISHPFNVPPPNREILLGDDMTSYPKPLSILSVWSLEIPFSIIEVVPSLYRPANSRQDLI